MSRRLPRPAEPVRVRLELTPDELRRVEDAAHLCRLSVASFVRVAILDAVADPDGRFAAWSAVAQRLGGEPLAQPEPPAKKKRGRAKG